MLFRQLESFLVTAEECNFTRAAQKLFISQQALSEQINRLEAEYGAKFFQRGKKLELTYEGQCMLKTAKEILQLNRQLCNQLNDRSPTLQGELTFGLSFARARTFFPVVLKSFHEKYPLVKVNIKSGNLVALKHYIAAGMVDLVMSYDYYQDLNLHKIPLGTERLYAIIPQSILIQLYPDSWKEQIPLFSQGIGVQAFSQIPLMLVNAQNHIYGAIHEQYRKYNLLPNIFFESNDMDLLYNLAKTGMGITFLPELLVATKTDLFQDQGSHTLYAFPLQDSATDMPFIIGYSKKHYLSLPMQEFIKELQQQYFLLTDQVRASQN
ncbi:LysR family transcriptional regulator [Hominifimenecus sp. rT4P-3]|uniref:LysR family transcriptional regulator n=1 Tax=Hominifimenecus sp. rT4P-3 TaxID=3242979 RepID=UPI003DA48761